MNVQVGNSGVQKKGCYSLACVGMAYSKKNCVLKQYKIIFYQTGALEGVIRSLAGVKRRV